MPSSLLPWRYVHATAIAVLTSFKLCDVISTLPYFPQLCASQPVPMEARAYDTTTVVVLMSCKLCDVISIMTCFPQLCASQPVAMEARACDTTTVAVLKDGPGKGAKKVSVKVLKL